MCLVGLFIFAVVAGRLLNEKQDCQKPKTNADMIRSMSDEELACFILEVGCPDHTVCSGNCKVCRKEWLKSPHKEEKEWLC